MTLYVDTSALLKLYVEEAESSACEAYLGSDDDWVTGRHTFDLRLGEVATRSGLTVVVP
ncbi:MAG: hypothetical protein WEB03_09625 [Nitriliruptor sp.]|uniref:hypothetical protein n=1 Tax=Nitriliruptor sp. TaxID=2448056 RepID=UPI00349FEBFB